MLFDLQLDPAWLRAELQRQAAQQHSGLRLGPLRLPGRAGQCLCCWAVWASCHPVCACCWAVWASCHPVCACCWAVWASCHPVCAAGACVPERCRCTLPGLLSMWLQPQAHIPHLGLDTFPEGAVCTCSAYLCALELSTCMAPGRGHRSYCTSGSSSTHTACLPVASALPLLPCRPGPPTGPPAHHQRRQRSRLGCRLPGWLAARPQP
jgi:hypothetical protein